jgi:hypothetical protein
MFDRKKLRNLKSVKSMILSDPTITDGYDDLLGAIMLRATHDCFVGLSQYRFEKASLFAKRVATHEAAY